MLRGAVGHQVARVVFKPFKPHASIVLEKQATEFDPRRGGTDLSTRYGTIVAVAAVWVGSGVLLRWATFQVFAVEPI